LSTLILSVKLVGFVRFKNGNHDFSMMNFIEEKRKECSSIFFLSLLLLLLLEDYWT
jgi:hypothetical protein